MSRSFEDTKQMAADNLSDMEHELAILYRSYRNCIQHGAVNAAAEYQEKLEALEQNIAGETEMFRMAFY